MKTIVCSWQRKSSSARKGWGILQAAAEEARAEVELFRGAGIYGIVLLLVSVFACVCPSARAADQVDLIEQMNALETSTSLDSPDLKPWHLRATYDILDSAGKSTDHGTIEEWWAGPELWKLSFRGTDYVDIELQNADDRFHSEEPRSAPTLVRDVLRQIIHPAPTVSEIKQATLESQTVPFGPVKLGCVMVGRPVKNVLHPPAGLFPTFCFEPGNRCFARRSILADSSAFGTGSASSRIATWRRLSRSVIKIIRSCGPRWRSLKQLRFRRRILFRVRSS